MDSPMDHEISLRLMDLGDVDEVIDLETDPNLYRFWRWKPYMSREEAIRYITKTVIPHPYHRAICVNDKAVGTIKVSTNWGDDSCRGELSYAVGSDWWGKGIATRALKLLLDTVFEDRPELERLEALVDVENKASMRVLDKAGFTKEGVLRSYVTMKGRLRDMAVFSVLRSDPKPLL